MRRSPSRSPAPTHALAQLPDFPCGSETRREPTSAVRISQMPRRLSAPAPVPQLDALAEDRGPLADVTIAEVADEAEPRRFPRWLIGVAVAMVAAGAYAANAHRVNRRPYEWSGSVETHAISVGSRTGGRVKEVLAVEGQQVHAGDILIRLEASDLLASKALAEAEIEMAEAALEKLSNGARPDEIARAAARLAESRAAVEQSGTQAAQDYKELARARKLFEQGSISAAERDQRSAAARVATGSTAGAQARSREAAAALRLLTGGSRPEDIRAARAQVAAAKAKLGVVVEQIEELSVRAPRDGRIESLTIRPGDILAPRAPAAVVLEKGQLFVRVYVPETQIGNLAIGQEVPVYVDSFPGRAFTGRVEHINDVGEFTPRRLSTIDERSDEVFGARIGIQDGADDLRAGMAAFARVPKKR